MQEQASESGNTGRPMAGVAYLGVAYHAEEDCTQE